MNLDPKIIPQSEADIVKAIDQGNDFIEQYRIQEIPVCIDGLCEEIE